MGILDLVTNTVEGVAEVATNTAKLAASPVLGIADPDAPVDAVEGIESGSKKIGKSDSKEQDG